MIKTTSVSHQGCGDGSDADHGFAAIQHAIDSMAHSTADPLRPELHHGALHSTELHGAEPSHGEMFRAGLHARDTAERQRDLTQPPRRRLFDAMSSRLRALFQ